MVRILAASILIFLPLLASAQTAAQKQGQGQRQDTNVIFAGKSTTAVARAFAYAPHIITKCRDSAALGGQGQFFGFSIAGSYDEDFCQRAELIKMGMELEKYQDVDELWDGFDMVKDLPSHKNKDEAACKYPTEECKQWKKRY